VSEEKFKIIEGAYLEDILHQPIALRDTLRSLGVTPRLREIAIGLRRGEFRRVVLTGMGSSLHALYPLSLRLNEGGQTALLIETSELVHYLGSLLEEDSLIVAVSQSGQSAEILRLLERPRNGMRIVAVTNTADSQLAQLASATLLTYAGPEFSVSAKTYVTALMALEFVGSVLLHGESSGRASSTLSELSEAADLVADYLKDWRSHVMNLASILGEVRHLFLVGRGRSLAAARTGALILKESTKFYAEGMSSAAFRHGPIEMLSEEALVAIFEGQEPTRALNRRLFSDICSQGGRGVLIGAKSEQPALRLPPAPDSVRPILEILPVQMMTLALSARTGTEAGRFELATKITAIE